MHFAQRGLRLRLVFIAAAARQRPLRAVGAQRGGAAGQQKRRFRRRPVPVSAIATAARLNSGAASSGQARERPAQLCDIPPGGIIKWTGHCA